MRTTDPVLQAIRDHDSALFVRAFAESRPLHPDDLQDLLCESWRHRNVLSADFLLTAGADINAANRDGTTPLLAAVESGCATVLSEVLQRGADPNRFHADGTQPLIVALDVSMESAELDFQSSGGVFVPRGDLVEALLRFGADPDLKDLRGTSAREYARLLHHTVGTELIDRFVPERHDPQNAPN